MYSIVLFWEGYPFYLGIVFWEGCPFHMRVVFLLARYYLFEELLVGQLRYGACTCKTKFNALIQNINITYMSFSLFNYGR